MPEAFGSFGALQHSIPHEKALKRASSMKGGEGMQARNSVFQQSYNEAYKKKMKKLLKDDEKEAISKKPKRQQLYKLFKLIINRKDFQYSYFHAFERYLRCFRCKSRKSLKAYRNGKDGMRHLYFKKAKTKLKQDLDISGLLQVRYGFEILKSLLFD